MVRDVHRGNVVRVDLLESAALGVPVVLVAGVLAVLRESVVVAVHQGPVVAVPAVPGRPLTTPLASPGSPGTCGTLSGRWRHSARRWGRSAASRP